MYPHAKQAPAQATYRQKMNWFRPKYIVVYCLIIIAGIGAGVLTYKHNLNNHLTIVTGEADALLAVTNSYVSLYSEMREQLGEGSSPVPASFRAEAVERFNSGYTGESHFLTQMVGMPARFVSTAPVDDDMRATLNKMSSGPVATVHSDILETDNQTIVRTMYPSIATHQTCVDCHNQMLNSTDTWELGDVMGAYVVERSIQSTKERYFFIAAMVGCLSTLMLLFGFVLVRFYSDLKLRSAELKKMAHSDPLTGCLNRRALDNRSNALTKNSRKNTAILVLDIDHFKSINDTHGHEVGDKVLVWFARAVRSQLRSGDVLARVGGEEFVVYLLDTPETVAHSVAERICRRVASETLDFGATPFSVTVSIGGVHTSRVPNASFKKYSKLADEFLYKAKAAGRNRVVWSSA